MSGFKMWDDFTQKEIRDKYKHVNGILYHLKDSGKNGRWYKAGDPVKVYKIVEVIYVLSFGVVMAILWSLKFIGLFGILNMVRKLK